MSSGALSALDSSPEWVICPQCRNVVYGKRLVRNQQVCPDCGRHGPQPAAERLVQLLDPDTVEELDFAVHSGDPLRFVDTRPYAQRLREAQVRTGLAEAVVCARGRIGGHPLIVAVMDFRFLGGSLGGAVGELITRAAETALDERLPLLIVTASGGARMQEGAISLMQMAKTSLALGRLDEAGILTISLVTDPTYGGVAASFATLCDVIIAEPRARLGFAGPRVIRQTIRQELPPGFQTAEFLLERGLIDGVRQRSSLRTVLSRLLAAGGRERSAVVAGPPVAEPAAADPAEPAAVGEPAAVEPGAVEPVAPAGDNPAWTAVKAARELNRPTTRDYASRILDDFEELRGDRVSGDCAAIIGGLGLLGGQPVVFIGHQKGHNITELAAHNFGMPAPAGYRKAARLMRLAGKLRLPVVTLVDTPGAYPGLEAEERGQAVAIAENIRLMAGLPVPIVTVIIGEGGSGGALALAVADRVFMLSNAVYSVISPEGCASILWKDPAQAARAAAALGVSAGELLEQGIVDGIIPEPTGGTGVDHALAAARLRATLLAALGPLVARDPVELVAARRARFRAFGRYGAPVPNEEGFADVPADIQ